MWNQCLGIFSQIFLYLCENRYKVFTNSWRNFKKRHLHRVFVPYKWYDGHISNTETGDIYRDEKSNWSSCTYAGEFVYCHLLCDHQNGDHQI